MFQQVVIVGIGEMGGVFARGFLRGGRPVVPVTRELRIDDVAMRTPDPALVLVAVSETDLASVLESLPGSWRERVALLQNELLPSHWTAHGIETPTIIVPWFEKKRGRDVRVLLATPVYGPRADLVRHALRAVHIPERALAIEGDVLFELVRKTLFILTTNIAGLVTRGTVGDLWENHRELAQEVLDETFAIQSSLAETDLPRERLYRSVRQAFDADPERKCTGRSAPERLGRALAHADKAGLATPKLREIARQITIVAPTI